MYVNSLSEVKQCGYETATMFNEKILMHDVKPKHFAAVIVMAWMGMSASWNASPRYGFLHKKAAALRLALGLKKILALS